MTIISDGQLADFLTNYPLYQKLMATEGLIAKYATNVFTNHLDFKDKAFKFKCPVEKEIHTFRTELSGSESFYGRFHDRGESDDELPGFFDPRTKKLDMTVHLNGVCQSCKYQID